MFKKVKAKLISYIDQAVDRRIDGTVDRKIEQILPVLAQLVDFHNSPEEKHQSYYDRTRNLEELKKRFLNNGIPVEEMDIDINDFENWLDSFPALQKHYSHMGDVVIEKCLEHYLTYNRLNIRTEDIFIDIAACGSPWANILRNSGVKSYRLDMTYPKGIHGIDIGANAADTKLPSNFASVLALHCAFQCFMGDSDFLFIREANRILKKDGRLGIVPLYCDHTYFVLTSPYYDQQFVHIETGAKRVWRDDKYQEPFSRYYSPEVFAQRIFSELGNMKGKLLFVGNLGELLKKYPGQKVYCHFMFYGQKL